MKKEYIPLPKVMEFIGLQNGEVIAQYAAIIEKLVEHGRLEYPEAEKVEKDLFAIRILTPVNARIFYVYYGVKHIIGIHAYEKKTRKIPEKELKYARRILKIIKNGGLDI